MLSIEFGGSLGGVAMTMTIVITLTISMERKLQDCSYQKQ